MTEIVKVIDLTFCCRNCPDWEPLIQSDGKPLMFNTLYRQGRCKTNIPRPVVMPNGVVSNFPWVDESEWCRPGRTAMQIAKMPPAPPPAPEPKKYDTLG